MLQTTIRTDQIVRQVRGIRPRLPRVVHSEKGDGAMHENRHIKQERVGRRTIPRMVILLTLTAALGVIGFLAAGSIARSATRTSATVSLRKTKLGLILVNSRGHTLYLFGKDRNGKSACSGSCARFWPPLLSRGAPTGGSGVRASLLGTTRRSTGSLQVTYNRHPLYTFALDKQAGQIHGEGNFAFGAKWYAVSAKGTAIVKAPTITSTASTTTTCAYPPC
jgi:predicted lipoprotein with Yx(FWY)xxD motif